MKRALAVLGVACLVFSLPASAVKITEYTIPTDKAVPTAIVAGPDGRLWFTETAQKKLGAVTTDGVFTEYPLANGPRSIAVLPGRLLAFTEDTGLGFAKVDGTATEYPGFNLPRGLVLGPDGRIWICDGGKSVLAFHFLANSPDTQTIPLSSDAYSIAVGQDGRIWVAQASASIVSACFVETGTCVDYPVKSSPLGIAAGPDGSVWFTETGGYIGRITAHGALAEFPIPTPYSDPHGICAGPDGNMWFTEYNTSKIGRITPDGTITDYDVPTAGSYPNAITLGPDGNLWFLERIAGKVGKLQIVDRGDPNGDGARNVSDALYLINHLFAGGPAPK